MNDLFPKYAILNFKFSNEVIFSLPVFLLLNLAISKNKSIDNDFEYDQLLFAPDKIQGHQQRSFVIYLQSKIDIKNIRPCLLKVISDHKNIFCDMWKRKLLKFGKYTITLNLRCTPTELFRYTQYNPERLENIFAKNMLYFPSPSAFNDPFDCALDEAHRLTFIESGICSFSKSNDNFLLFSHYAANHTGICIGINPEKLLQMKNPKNNHTVSGEMRPVWYFNKMPSLNLFKQPAICATCKHDLWSYEEEYRLFVQENGKLLPYGNYSISEDAITSIVFGCRASDECISFTKAITSHMVDLKYFRAHKIPNVFGLTLREIKKL